MSSAAPGGGVVEAVSEVPDDLKKLVRYVLRGFYQTEHALTMDLLIHHPCIKEDDMLELLKFERKQLRAVINTLKMDKFLKSRMRVETDAEGKTTRHNYYFINYSVFVNVVKYKLDHMQKKIETQERDATNRASYKCPACEKTFTDLEADQLFDPMSGTFVCTYCQTEVEEESGNVPKTDARTLMVKFNEQMESLYTLLRTVEDVKLSADILEPEPVDLKTARPQGGSRAPGEKGTWSGDATKYTDYGMYASNQVVINMEGENAEHKAEKAAPKERPIWMVHSTIEGASSESMLPGTAGGSAGGMTSQTSRSAKDNDAIMQTLLAHEKKSSGPQVAGIAPSDNESSTSESEDESIKPSASNFSLSSMVEPGGAVEEMESNEEEEEEESVVSVRGQRVPYHDVTPAMVEHMTPQEKDEYIRMGQEMYEMYH